MQDSTMSTGVQARYNNLTLHHHATTINFNIEDTNIRQILNLSEILKVSMWYIWSVGLHHIPNHHQHCHRHHHHHHHQALTDVDSFGFGMPSSS